jgi:ABC-type multidrug transport system ATPase subunit
LIPDEGSAQVMGYDVVHDYQKIRKEVGYMPGRFSLYTDLTVEENLNFFANIFNTTVAQNYHLIKEIYQQIEPFKRVRAGKLSGGMKQKLALSCALIHKPKVLFLDEPTTGVDAVSRKEFWELLKNLKAQGITILVSTPYMDEAAMCDRVGLIQNGNLMQVNTPEGLKTSFGKKVLALSGDNLLKVADTLRTMPIVDAVYPFGEVHHLVLKQGVNHVELPEGIQAIEVEPDVEDCFISLMKSHA